jgi:hypothetical protein
VASQHTIHHTQEREFSSGMLSVTSTFRLMVTGDTDLKHLDRIIRILRVQQQILAEDEIEDCLPDIVWYCPPALERLMPQDCAGPAVGTPRPSFGITKVVPASRQQTPGA